MFRFKSASTAAIRRKMQLPKLTRKSRKRKRQKSDGRDARTIAGCVGRGMRLGERRGNTAPRPARQGCSSRCRHASHLKNIAMCPGAGKTDDWISEDMYKHFTETDSRPLTPENYSRRSVTLPRSSSVGIEKVRKCVTPEPDTKQCQFHNRRVLILDLRRVKSVDAITRQNSLTTAESVDSTYGDCDYDNRSSSVNRDSSSLFHHSTPRNFSMSRSTSPKGGRKPKNTLKKPVDRPGSPVAYERSSSPKILEGLTLPPLHQSVLTLLGQKSGSKSSPRNLNVDPFDSGGGTNKAKKLRRHGRKKKTKDDGKESEEKELEKPGPAVDGTDGKGDTEELQETQVQTLKNQDDDDEQEAEEETQAESPTYVKNIVSLRDVLDEHLCKDQWSQKEMEALNVEIEKLSVGLKKYQTDFKAKSISMKEETWLAFPRTFTNTSATFGVPLNSQQLQKIRPVDYLRDYVVITEPRRHLYNLIFQRYRILENPMGKSITVKSLQRALTEVLGRQFHDDEITELRNVYLNVDNSFELDPKIFAGICAFTERIYGKYELEKCSECIICSTNRVNDKERCHKKRKSELEHMDLSFLSSKIKLGEAQDNLKPLITALTEIR